MRLRGLTLKVVSQATGIPSSTLSEWTANRAPVLGPDVLKLARFFGVSIEYLVTGQEPEPDLVDEIFGDEGDGFVTLHKGVYRVKVEKYSPPLRKKKEEI